MTFIDNKLEYGYIYLIKIDNTDHYKIGKTKDFNKRFSNYKNLIPTVILQIYIQDYHLAEKKLIEQFKNKFKNIKERGTEYFSGNELELRNVILNYVLNSDKEKIETTLEFTSQLVISDDESENDEEEEKIITTWAEYKTTTKIKDIFITNKKTLSGFIRYEGNCHRLIEEDETISNFENLKQWLENNTWSEVDYDKLIKDISNKCYTNIKPYKLKYNETIIRKYSRSNKILNFETFVEKDILSLPPIKRIIFSSSVINNFNILNVPFAEGLLESYIIDKNLLSEYKKMFKSIFIKQNDKPIIIYDTSYNVRKDYNLHTILKYYIYRFVGSSLYNIDKKFKSYCVSECYDKRLFIICRNETKCISPTCRWKYSYTLIKENELELKKIIEYLEKKKPCCNIIILNSRNNFYDPKSLTEHFHKNKEQYKNSLEDDRRKDLVDSRLFNSTSDVLEYLDIEDIFDYKCFRYETLYVMLN
jgi:hypothetical protein